MSQDRKRGLPNVDCDSAKRGVWLVKVPRYLSQIWEANEGSDVGRLILQPPQPGKKEVQLKSRPNLIMPPELLKSAPEPSTGRTSVTSKKNADKNTIPDEHDFVIGDIANQTMAVLTEDKQGLNEDADIRSGKLSIEGRVVKRAECRPPDSLAYLRLKIGQIEKSGQPKRQVVQISRAAVKFKPVSAHDEDKRRIKQKKEGAKTVRADRDQLINALFHAFEKHQYYRLQDLQQLLNQPAGYVKEILQDIAVYNTAPPHKSMWELKPEYRNYGNKDKGEDDD